MKEKLAYSVKEAALLLGLSDWKVRELYYSKHLRSVKAGQRLLIPAAALMEFLDPEPARDPLSSDQ